GAPASYTNEDLHRLQVAEAKSLGIRAIGVQEEPKRRSLLGPRTNSPQTRAYAENAIRELAAMRHQIDESQGKPAPVPLGGNPAQRRGEGEQGGKALEADAAAPAARPAAWAGQHSGDLSGGRTIGDSRSWQELWSKVSAEPAPAVDFSREQVVGVFLGR